MCNVEINKSTFSRYCGSFDVNTLLTFFQTCPADLTKRDIVLDVYEKTNYAQKEVRETVQLTLDAIAEALSQGRNVELRNFGVFEVQVRKSRIGRNPNKPETDVVIQSAGRDRHGFSLSRIRSISRWPARSLSPVGSGIAMR